MIDAYYVAGTGHRPDKLGGYGAVNPVRDGIKSALVGRLLLLRQAHPDLRCISGMALGFDQWLAEVCVGYDVPFVAAVPFRGQEAHWPADSQQHYRDLLARAAEVVVVSPGGYSAKKMQVRNEWMVDRCQLLLAAWDGTAGGTANCIRYAQKVGRPWDNVLPGLKLVRA